MVKTILSCFILALAFGFYAVADDQYSSSPPKTTTATKGDVTLTAKLIDEAMLSKDKMAKVEVTVTGAKLAAGHKAMAHGNHLHYQIDDSPIIVTPESSLSFAGLTPGKHTISVTVVDHKHSPLAGPQTVEVTIP